MDFWLNREKKDGLVEEKEKVVYRKINSTRMLARQNGRAFCGHCVAKKVENPNQCDYRCLEEGCEFNYVCKGCEKDHPIDHVFKC